MIKDYNAVPCVIAVRNTETENLIFRFKDIQYNLNQDDEVCLTVKTSEDLAYLNKVIKAEAMEQRIPLILDYSNQTVPAIPGTYSKIIFNDEVKLRKYDRDDNEEYRYMAGTFTFTLDGTRHQFNFNHAEGKLAGMPDVDYVIFIANRPLPGMPTNRAGVLYVMGDDGSEYYTMKLVDPAFKVFEGEITAVCESTAGPNNIFPVNLGYLVK